MQGSATEATPRVPAELEPDEEWPSAKHPCVQGPFPEKTTQSRKSKIRNDKRNPVASRPTRRTRLGGWAFSYEQGTPVWKRQVMARKETSGHKPARTPSPRCIPSTVCRAFMEHVRQSRPWLKVHVRETFQDVTPSLSTVGQTVLNFRTNTPQKCEAVPRRARVQGS